ncbi:MAG: BrnA antitoxin family protein [Sphingomonadaceae bacterium]|nr:BrnA antitoxin family protein [Sphingomonadaceae bacterium]
MSKPPPPSYFDDNPEWTEEDFARARQLADRPDIAVMRAKLVRPRGRPEGSTTSTKSLVSLRLDNDIIARFRATGPGWQSRINALLREAKL